jgi:hypothetical protein
MSNRKYVAIFSIMSGILTMLAIRSQLGQPIYAAAHTSGYNHGCSDAQISDPSERYINQPEKGPSFHSEAFMQAYHDGFNACSSGNGGSSDNNNNNINENHARPARSIAGNYATGYETDKEQGKNDYNSGNQHDNACPRDFWNNISYCSGYKIGYEAGWGASKLLG